MDLFIPTKINKDNRFGAGIGVKEFKRVIIGALIGIPTGLIAGVGLVNDIKTILIIAVIVTCLFAGATYFAVMRTSINLSVYIFMGLMKKFYSEQQFYKYKKMKEWGY